MEIFGRSRGNDQIASSVSSAPCDLGLNAATDEIEPGLTLIGQQLVDLLEDAVGQRQHDTAAKQLRPSATPLLAGPPLCHQSYIRY
jgi:hypothetical protein